MALFEGEGGLHCPSQIMTNELPRTGSSYDVPAAVMQFREQISSGKEVEQQFVFGAAKVFLIFSVIAYALYQVESFKKAIDNKTTGSIVMPHLLSVGSFIIKLDTTKLTDNVGKAVDTVVETTKKATETTSQKSEVTSDKITKALEDTKKEVQDSVESTVNDVKDSIKENIVNEVEKKIENSTSATEEQIQTVKEKLQSIVDTKETQN